MDNPSGRPDMAIFARSLEKKLLGPYQISGRGNVPLNSETQLKQKKLLKFAVQ